LWPLSNRKLSRATHTIRLQFLHFCILEREMKVWLNAAGRNITLTNGLPIRQLALQISVWIPSKSHRTWEHLGVINVLRHSSETTRMQYSTWSRNFRFWDLLKGSFDAWRHDTRKRIRFPDSLIPSKTALTKGKNPCVLLLRPFSFYVHWSKTLLLLFQAASVIQFRLLHDVVDLAWLENVARIWLMSVPL
jgi:hypothetical protein